MAAQASTRRVAYGNRFLRAGLPLVSLVVIGWFGLAQLVQVRAARRGSSRHVSRAHARDCASGQDRGAGRAAAREQRALTGGCSAPQVALRPRGGACGALCAWWRHTSCGCVTRSLVSPRHAQRLKEAIDINNYKNKPVPRSR